MGGEWDLVTRVAVWGVAFGVVGARALPRPHLVERGARPRSGRACSRCGRAASASGAASSSARSPGAVVVRRSGYDICEVPRRRRRPGLLLAQGIGRIGNWWNQELYGKPTKLPWGLEISVVHRPLPVPRPRHLPPDVPLRADLGLRRRRDAAVRLETRSRSGRRRSSRSTWPGTASAASSRSSSAIDPSHHIAGLRLNAWVSIILFCGSTTYFILHQFGGPAVPRRRRKHQVEEHRPAMAIPKGGKGRVRHGR